MNEKNQNLDKVEAAILTVLTGTAEAVFRFFNGEAPASFQFDFNRDTAGKVTNINISPANKGV